MRYNCPTLTELETLILHYGQNYMLYKIYKEHSHTKHDNIIDRSIFLFSDTEYTNI